MKKIAIILISILLTGCGISTEDKDYMQTVLNNRIGDYYAKENMPVMLVNAELTSIEEKESYLLGRYFGRFGCSFEHNGDKIHITGAVAFDENMQITTMPIRYGENKVAIDIMVVQVNNKSEDRAASKYTLDCFVNRNKVTGNE